MPSDSVEALVWLVTEGARLASHGLPTCVGECDAVWLSVYGEHVGTAKSRQCHVAADLRQRLTHDPGVNVTRRAMGQARMKYLERSRRAYFYPPFARDDPAASQPVWLLRTDGGGQRGTL